MSDNQYQSDDHLTFSQRYGYEPLPGPMQLEELSDDLRREIWNAMRRYLKDVFINIYTGASGYRDERGYQLFENILGEMLREPEDEIDTSQDGILYQFKSLILQGNFNVVLDLIEIMVNRGWYEKDFVNCIDELFERDAAAYYLDMSDRPHKFFPRGNKAQGDATREAIKTIRNGGMKGAETHLRDAAAHINARQFGDSISDSIHAVESVARQIDPKSKTLGPALNSLEKAGLIKHPALKEAFSKLYGYTSNEQGIRHALLNKNSPDVDLDEALFMFGACASFAAYLVNKHHKMQEEDDE